MKILKNIFWTNYNNVNNCRVKKKKKSHLSRTVFLANKIKKMLKMKL